MLLPLIKHEHGQTSNNKTTISWKWIAVYVMVIFIALVIILSLTEIHRKFNPQYIWYIFWALPFVALSFGIYSVHREWSQNTWSIWLSLPYSRLMLLAAKSIDSLFRTVRIFLLAYMGIALCYTIYLLFHPTLGYSDWLEFFLSGLKWIIPLLIMIPVAITFGIMVYSFSKTTWQPLVTLIWMLAWISWGFLSGFGYIKTVPVLTDPLIILSALIIVSIISLCCLSLAAYALERKFI